MRKGPRHLVEVLFIILNVLAVSINVACNSENQCFDDAKLLLIHYHSKYFYLFRQKNYVNVYNKNMSVTI